MRRRFLVLALAAVLLGGCGWTDGTYISVTPHQVGLSQSGGSTAREVGSYTQLRGALIGLIDSGSTEGLFSLVEYPRDAVVADMQKLVDYAMVRYPLGAYAVESITYDLGTGLGASAMSVDITYRPGAAESLDRIRTVRWISGAETAIQGALDECAEGLILQISGYRKEDFHEMVRTYAQENPDRVMEAPTVTVSVYPDTGDVRVVELRFQYRTDRETLRTMRDQVQPVFSSAALYVSGSADEETKFSQLHNFLMERHEYAIGSSVTPAYDLLCRGMGDAQSFAQVYAAMCRRIGLEATCIQGTREGVPHWWNQVRIGESWYHLDLLASRRFEPMADGEMTGYTWVEEQP